MVQSIDFNKPVYSAVNINIKKPEVNASKITNPVEINNDNGIYNAVKIDIDNPQVNTEPKPIYEYPQADGIVTYKMLNINPVALPEKEKDNAEIEDADLEISQIDTEEPSEEEETEIPASNYTTANAEKQPVKITENNSEVNTALSFHGTDTNVKKPEIVPSEDILPKVDIGLVINNLKSNDADVQALQLEEIFRTSIYDKKNAKNYLVSDVFAELINISEQDVTKLAPPTKQQIEIRKKLISNIMAVEKDKNAAKNLPYKISDEEIKLATNLSPLEVVERNKEYAITTLGSLAELFIEDYEEKEKRILPITDVPGVSAIVNALRKDPDSSVKLSAIDALRHIQRPEYKEELVALFTLAQTDTDPYVAKAAALSLQQINQKQ